jgi:eukaryotic-like serine/threonine-protein kinase
VFEPHSGDVVGRYRLLDAVGAGGMGQVWLAEAAISAGVQRKVALKFLQGSGVVDQLFADEVAVLAHLHHPNVVQLLDSGQHEGTPWYAMEWIPGQSVLSVMKPDGQLKGLPVSVALSVALDVCDGLGAVHDAASPDGSSLGIVHRDVAPANVVITSSGLCKLIDFGIAVSSMRKAESTHSGLIRGRVAYLSPERLLNDPVDGRADQWSLGVMLYEMVAGRRLFERAGDASQSMQLILAGAPDLTGLPQPLSEVVSRMLQLDPNQRFATMGEVRTALEAAARTLKAPLGHNLVRRYVEGIGEGATDLRTPQILIDGPTARNNVNSPLRLMLMAAIGLVVMALVAVAGTLVWSSLRGPPARSDARAPPPEATDPIVPVRAQIDAGRVEPIDAAISDMVLQADAGAGPEEIKAPVKTKKRRSPIDELAPLD